MCHSITTVMHNTDSTIFTSTLQVWHLNCAFCTQTHSQKTTTHICRCAKVYINSRSFIFFSRLLVVLARSKFWRLYCIHHHAIVLYLNVMQKNWKLSRFWQGCECTLRLLATLLKFQIQCALFVLLVAKLMKCILLLNSPTAQRHILEMYACTNKVRK